MQYHVQLVKHDPPRSYGDCVRTCIACILHLQPESVPNFFHGVDLDGRTVDDCWSDLDSWLEANGWRYVLVNFEGMALAQLFEYASFGFRDIPYIIFGDNHAVIGYNDKIIHDPSWTKRGVRNPQSAMILIRKYEGINP